MMLGTWPNDCRTGVGRTKLSFWNTKFLEKYSVNLNFSTTYSHPWYSHLAMYQALLYLKTNLPVCLFTHSKDIKIGQSCQELRGVSKSPLELKHPVRFFCLETSMDCVTACKNKFVVEHKMMLNNLRILSCRSTTRSDTSGLAVPALG